MEFRPCIDIHNGKVKQIVGKSLNDESGRAEENFVAEQDAAFFANFYKEKGIRGGHVILLNPAGSAGYEETKAQALGALRAYPSGLQAGGGINPDNAEEFLEAGASHVIVTSYVFRDGLIDWGRLERMRACVGRERLVLDLSCRKREEGYVVVTDRWQKDTDEVLCEAFLTRLSEYCDEFLVHAVDVEGRAEGIEEELAGLLGNWGRIPVTYAGGVRDLKDLRKLKKLGRGKINVTVGSSLDIFGGSMSIGEVISFCGRDGDGISDDLTCTDTKKVL